MNPTGAILAGLIGAVAMTALMAIAPMMGMPKMDILNMLGTMFTAGSAARLVGGIIHLMMGAVFGLVYAFLWTLFGAPTLVWGLIFGVVHGLLSSVAMPMMMAMHPRPPEMQRGPMTMLGMVIGHAVFGIVVALVYGGFAG